jgi:hypothetical protein
VTSFFLTKKIEKPKRKNGIKEKKEAFCFEIPFHLLHVEQRL